MTDYKREIGTLIQADAILILGIVVCLIMAMPAHAVTTYPAQNISGYGSNNASVTLVGGDPAVKYCWFEVGRNGGIYPYNTSAKQHTGQVLYNITGYPLMSDTMYHYRYCCDDGCGVDISFRTNASKIMPDTTYAQEYLNPVIESDWNFTLMSEKAQKVFNVPLGSLSPTGSLVIPIFVGGLWILLLGMIWIRTESAIIPFFMSMILSGWLFGTYFTDSPMLPPEWQWTLAAALVVSVAGFIYFLYKGR